MLTLNGNKALSHVTSNLCWCRILNAPGNSPSCMPGDWFISNYFKTCAHNVCLFYLQCDWPSVKSKCLSE